MRILDEIPLVFLPPPFQTPAQGVDVPLFPVLAAALGLVAILAVSLGALRVPRMRRAAPKSRLEPAKPVQRAPPLPPAPTIVYKKAPVSIELPQIKPAYPDVWGVNDPLDIVLRLTDKGLLGQKVIPGLTVAVGGQPVTPFFLRGVTSVRKAFPERGEPEIVVEYRVEGEAQPRRTTRRLKVVDYRQEITEVFDNFKREASQAITPLREDATPWEIYDALTGANHKIPRAAIRDIVSCFEEAKFSNHAVTRATYDRMIHALLQLERAEL